jgi:hypothetical protein
MPTGSFVTQNTRGVRGAADERFRHLLRGRGWDGADGVWGRWGLGRLVLL